MGRFVGACGNLGCRGIGEDLVVATGPAAVPAPNSTMDALVATSIPADATTEVIPGSVSAPTGGASAASAVEAGASPWAKLFVAAVFAYAGFTWFRTRKDRERG